MNTSFTRFALIAGLCVAGTATAYAAIDTSFGQASVAVSRARTVTVDSQTKYINVERGETVTINAGGKTVTWKFDTPYQGSIAFPLSKIVPEAGGTTVYVSQPYLGSIQ
ncbi:CzcE family metal-binding protein [Propionivibrio soli]|uniref:CzcE family metal-binding protein n=1 Tax=Propionivibrio soli TaxID=2976531 RepID=UPI0021E926C5|nr:CzcE family metal-binding protein [Propionivibrio soli]